MALYQFCIYNRVLISIIYYYCYVVCLDFVFVLSSVYILLYSDCNALCITEKMRGWNSALLLCFGFVLHMHAQHIHNMGFTGYC